MSDVLAAYRLSVFPVGIGRQMLARRNATSGGYDDRAIKCDMCGLSGVAGAINAQ